MNTFKYRPNEIFLEDSEHKKVAYITFPNTEKGVYCIDHTVVDESLQGEGIAAQLCHRAVLYIHNKKGKVTATCEYAKKWMAENNIDE